MKKYVYILAALSLAGAILSGILLYQHFFPDAKLGLLTCGSGLVNPCITVSQSRFGTVLGIPLASFGLFYYLVILFTLLVADYASDEYPPLALGVLLPVIAFGVAFDVFLGAVLVSMKTLCPLCISTYAVNLLALAVLIVWQRSERTKDGSGLAAFMKKALTYPLDLSHKRAFASAFMLFVILLAFAVFSTGQILRTRTGQMAVSRADVNSFLKGFFGSPRENIDFMDQGIMLGDPGAPVTIVAFTDFLCSACYEFYKVEKFLLSKYPGKVRIVYFNYPLDRSCNQSVKNTVYGNSCYASRAFISAYKQGILEDYTQAHFAMYDALHMNYTPQSPMAVLDTIKPSRRNGMTNHGLASLLQGEEVNEILASHIAIAEKIKVNATPTIYIEGHKMVGVPPVDLMDALVVELLKRKG